MIYARQSVFNFIKTNVDTDLVGLVSPNFKAKIRLVHEAVEYGNILNITFLTDVRVLQTNPPYRELNCVLDLIAKISNPANVLKTESDILKAIHLINKFMAEQSIEKKNYENTPATNMGSIITWRQSYSSDWSDAAVVSSSYIHKRTTFSFRYFEEDLTT
jgi:hypothetical protein